MSKKDISKVTTEQLKHDYNRMVWLSKELFKIQGKYNNMFSGTYWSEQSWIIDELGRRSLDE